MARFETFYDDVLSMARFNLVTTFEEEGEIPLPDDMQARIEKIIAERTFTITRLIETGLGPAFYKQEEVKVSDVTDNIDGAIDYLMADMSAYVLTLKSGYWNGTMIDDLDTLRNAWLAHVYGHPIFEETN